MSTNQDQAKTLVTAANTQMKEMLNKNKGLFFSPAYKQASVLQKKLEAAAGLLTDVSKVTEAKTVLTTVNNEMLSLLDDNKSLSSFEMYKEAQKVQKSVAEAAGLL